MLHAIQILCMYIMALKCEIVDQVSMEHTYIHGNWETVFVLQSFLFLLSYFCHPFLFYGINLREFIGWGSVVL